MEHVPRHERYKCECGRTLSLCMKARHENSIGHQRYQEIQALLNTPGVVLEEIAVKMGVSRQHIQDIAKATQESWNGRQRRKDSNQGTE